MDSGNWFPCLYLLNKFVYIFSSLLSSLRVFIACCCKLQVIVDRFSGTALQYRACQQMTWFTASIITVRTFEWTRTFMNTIYMMLQITWLTGSITLRKLVWTHTIMNSIYMTLQMTWVWGSIITLRTLEWMQTFMNTIYMTLQTTWSSGSIITLRTLEWMQTFMNKIYMML